MKTELLEGRRPSRLQARITILAAFFTGILFLPFVSSQQPATSAQKFELLFLPLLIFGSLAISLAIYKSKRKTKK
jgi:hypothetical protein